MKQIHTYQSDYNFKEMTDEQVVVIAQEEQNEFAIDYIVNKYKNFVRAKARTYFLVGADRDDIIQEGMIGLYKATRDFKNDKLTSFRAFAELCITRQIITAIKSATRQKHAPLNSYISLNKPVYTDESERTLIEMLSSACVTNPEELIISREELDDIERSIGYILSDLEWEVLEGYLDGKSYQEMAAGTNRSVKSIDNALQRVKRKLEKFLEHRVLGVSIQEG
ncbi:RNA polymerase sporulation sigma factor SigH [Veillonella caviae]|uniref:RNA polymerase sporulation sigma factor SigH n=1 Tax=Veillonella caviae TaxID=248316 RepID=UPI000F8E57A0|nr:RNA polymerase sporulation sigma factor SigH [Veillonella caviae]MCF0157592.1 RNA polymerase sporulation sigma factor SigH [Veillonella sp.]MCI6407832.1 RNA polymerase sporulation sigma factor SigH [Veillonella caviae]MCI7693160.1 RNA polymerase sporulation sigma factor SigH [Veillonella caviae]MDD7291697.1 RNA polymerase sporulation sigma factor SigH [Veillonella caviae]MDY4746938.1 RNA polymerase sporulation sigma factor SigH [Veillonella caviae]